MNKQCTKCGAQVPVESNFCQACGGSEFFVNEAQQPAFAEQPVQQAWQPPMPQPKKKKTGLIIGIVAGALVVLAVIGMVAEKVFQNMGYGDSDDIDSDYVFDLGGDTDEEDTTPAVSYTKGTFNGVTYENKWADMKLVLPTGFSNADASTYATAENESTECGFYFVADDSTGLIYAYFEKLPTFPVYDEEEYMDAVMDTLAGISNFTTTDVYTTIVIGDYTYKKAECTFTNANGEFVATVYVRKLDDYMIVVSTMGANSTANDALAGRIIRAN